MAPRYWKYVMYAGYGKLVTLDWYFWEIKNAMKK